MGGGLTQLPKSVLELRIALLYLSMYHLQTASRFDQQLFVILEL